MPKLQGDLFIRISVLHTTLHVAAAYPVVFVSSSCSTSYAVCTTAKLLLQKSIKSAKGMQSLFLDLVPAMPVTPLGKTQPGGDSGVSEEAAAAMAETLAKRDAEVNMLC